jgi:eukaryotic-like serine/threonine-protein kinase
MTPSDMVTGRYRLLQPLDPAQVRWRAHDELLHRDVTLRRIDARDVPAVRAASGLAHPGVLRVHDVVAGGDGAWIVTEPADGPTLAVVGTLPETRAAAIGLDLLDALAAAHALGVVHGGVAPDTIVQARDGRFRLDAFGIGAVPPYTPPEGRRTPTGDLWALAATLLTVVEGRLPFASADALARGLLVPAVAAPRLGSLLLPLFHPDPAARPGAAELRRRLATLAPPLRTPGAPLRVRAPVLAAGALTLAALLVPTTFALVRPAPPEVPAAAVAAPATAPLTTLPDFCGLLTEEQLRRLVPTPDEPQKTDDGCNWITAGSSSPIPVPDAFRFRLSVSGKLVSEYADAFAFERSLAAALGSREVRLPGVGDEAYVYEGETSSGTYRDYTATVVFRQADAVVRMNLRRGGGLKNDKVLAAAIQGARWFAEGIRRG